MADLYLTRALWGGFLGAPGYSNFAFTPLSATTSQQANVDGAVTATTAFMQKALDLCPTPVRVQAESSVRIVEPTTGNLLGFGVTSTTPGSLTGQSLSNYWAGPSGGSVEWLTPTVVHNRLLRGRTFIVPAATNQYDNGVLNTPALASLNAAANLMISTAATNGMAFSIWTRPRKASSTKPAVVGAVGIVTDHRVPTFVSVLRSRRD